MLVRLEVGDVSLDKRCTNLVGQSLTAVGINIGDGDDACGLNESACKPLAEAVRTSGNEDRLVANQLFVHLIRTYAFTRLKNNAASAPPMMGPVIAIQAYPQLELPLPLIGSSQ